MKRAFFFFVLFIAVMSVVSAVYAQQTQKTSYNFGTDTTKPADVYTTSGFSATVEPIETADDMKASGIIGEGSDYLLGREDVVGITVRNQPDFTGNFVVGPDGKIQYTYVGDIPAEGLTKDELGVVLEEKLRKYVKSPEVSVAILAYRSKKIYVFGAVRGPGKYHIQGNTKNLLDAIVDAGMPTPDAALRRVYIIDPDPQKADFQKVDLVKLLYKGDMSQDFELQADDIVFVPTTVPSEINDALNRMLSPFFKAAAINDLLTDD